MTSTNTIERPNCEINNRTREIGTISDEKHQPLTRYRRAEVRGSELVKVTPLPVCNLLDEYSHRPRANGAIDKYARFLEVHIKKCRCAFRKLSQG